MDEAAPHICAMTNPGKDDTDKPGGWFLRVKTPKDLARTFYVYEPDQGAAIALAKEKVPVGPDQTIEVVRQVNINALTEAGMKPGDVLQHG
jgi:hypothetical protein